MRLLILFILLAPGTAIFSAAGQSWLTVSLRDTTFYYAGPHAGADSDPYFGSHYRRLNRVIRAVWAASKTSSGSGLIITFPKCWRDTTVGRGEGNSNCIDTLAPCWFGPRCIRQTDGTEYYFNSRLDTIMLKTLATPGTSWVLAKSRAGITYKATVAVADTLTIDGALDSFKTLQIQAYSGATPIPDWYNNLVLQFSKAHGWVKTLDLYRFPNNFSNWDYGCEVVDSTQHYRLPTTLAQSRISTDPFWLYVPGNEWIWGKWDKGSFYTLKFSASHDSVISIAPLGSSALLAQIKTKSSNGVITIHTDTISLTKKPLLFKDDYFSEGFITSPRTKRYFIDSASFCEQYFIERDPLFPGGGYYRDTCLRHEFIDAINYRHQTLLTNFGTLENYYYYETNYNSDVYYNNLCIYLKAGSCITGNKVDVTKLSAAAQAVELGSILPNPANSELKITLRKNIADCYFTLRSTTGVVSNGALTSSNVTIDTRDYPFGLYFLELWSHDSRQVFKVIISH